MHSVSQSLRWLFSHKGFVCVLQERGVRLVKCLLLKSFFIWKQKIMQGGIVTLKTQRNHYCLPLPVSVHERNGWNAGKAGVSRAPDEHTLDCQGLLSGLLILSLNVFLIMSPYWSCKCLCFARAPRVIQGPWADCHQRCRVVRFSHWIEAEAMMGDLINGKVP